MTSYHQLIMENHTIFAKKVWEQLADRGLTSGQPKILEYLFSNDGAVQKDIATAAQVEPATITNLLARMEKAGLIYRRPDPDNRRFWHVHLTDAGRVEAGFVLTAFQNMEAIALDGFTQKEIDLLLNALKRIRQNLV